MVNQKRTRSAWLRLSFAISVALCGVTNLHAQHAFEFATRVGANALLYKSDYGKPMPNYNVGVDFSWKYRSPYYIGLRMGLGFDVAASTFIGSDPTRAGVGYADNYHLPPLYAVDDADGVDVSYTLGRFSETQQLLIASAPIQLGIFVGDFSIFLGARVGVPIHGNYWQRIKDADVSLYYPGTGVTVGRGGSGSEFPDEQIEFMKAGLYPRTVNGLKEMSAGAFPKYYYHITAMVDLNYSFKVDDNVDVGIGAYLEYDPMGYKPAATDNTSLMFWKNGYDEATNEPYFVREYTSVLESNRADGGNMLTPGTAGENPVVKKYNRASVGLRISVSLWSVPLDFGKNYRKQQLYKVCMCDFF